MSLIVKLSSISTQDPTHNQTLFLTHIFSIIFIVNSKNA